jgi:chitodextrinase
MQMNRTKTALKPVRRATLSGRTTRLLPPTVGLTVFMALLFLAGTSLTALAQQPAPNTTFNVPVTGEIERLTLDNAADVWSGGTMVVGGQNIILPRNLLIDLPANRMTLQQFFTQAPAACAQRGESGVAKADTCNTSRTGGQVALTATRTLGRNVIAADVYIQKGIESVTGVVTYMNFTDGYLRLNGNPGDSTTGVMVRLNDPTGRHTVQAGSGCVAGTPNCSPDPRFTGDPDNYTQAFNTGFPACIPSTVSRTFTDSLDLNGNGSKTDLLTAVGSATGTGDILCPSTNRTVPAPSATGLQVDAAIQLVNDSRLFAPIQVGDHLTAKGNFETVNGVRFLSSWSTAVTGRLETKATPGQPDYMTITELFVAAPGFQDQRARATVIGLTTLDSTSAVGLNGSDVLLYSTHHDPGTNAVHEFPFGSTHGCDIASGRGLGSRCTFNEGAPNSWIVRYVVGFPGPAPFARTPELSACLTVRDDISNDGLRNRFTTAAKPLCPSVDSTGTASLEDEFGIFSPIMHEMQARTGRKVEDMQANGGNTTLLTIDVRGNSAPNGQFLFPMGLNLGGVDTTEVAELNVGLQGQALNLSGIPWLMDRRLSPGGCVGPCESTPQPLSPFPYEGVDPRLQADNFVIAGGGVPTGIYNDLNFTASPLTNASNRILSFVSPALSNFDGNNTILAWPPVDPPSTPITPTNIFTTPAACDTTAPTAPTTLTATGINATSITLTFTAGTDNVAITGFKVFADGAGFPIATTTTSPVTVGGFAPSTTHTFIVQAMDAAGNLSAPSNTASATTTADTTAPTAPAGLLATASGQTVINLTWTVSTDNVAVTGYRVFRDGVGTPLATVAGTAFSDNTLAPGSTHSYTVAAIDAANNQSAMSNTATATTATPPPVDTTAPSVPTGLIATGSSPSQIDLSWNASTDNVGVTGYKVYRDGVATEIATVTTGTSFTDGGLLTGSTHSYTVAAFDAANNLSAKSATATATTQNNVVLVSLVINPLTVKAPAKPTGTITLNGTAGAGGVAISLTSSDTQKATVPSAVIVPAGASSVTFQVTTLTGKLGGGSNPVNITASFAGVNKVVTINITR